MALLLKRGLTPDVELIVLSFTGPASYSTGGFDPGFPSSGALIRAHGVSEMNGKTTGYFAMGDSTAKKVKVLSGAAAGAAFQEVAAAVNLSTFTFIVEVLWLP